MAAAYFQHCGTDERFRINALVIGRLKLHTVLYFKARAGMEKALTFGFVYTFPIHILSLHVLETEGQILRRKVFCLHCSEVF
jgi:hypothetical protein